MNDLVTQLKEADQDFEFYPTTDEMCSKVARALKDPKSILDIGAGKGDALRRIVDLKYEGSRIIAERQEDADELRELLKIAHSAGVSHAIDYVRAMQGSD